METHEIRLEVLYKTRSEILDRIAELEDLLEGLTGRRRLSALFESVELRLEVDDRARAIEDLDEAEATLKNIVKKRSAKADEAMQACYWRLRADAFRSNGEIGDMNKARSCVEKAVTFAVASGDELEKARMFYAEGLTHLYDGHFTNTLESAKKGLDALDACSIRDDVLELDLATLQGRVFLVRGFYDTAHDDLSLCLSNEQCVGRRRRELLNYVGVACKGLGKFHEALIRFRQAAQVAEEFGSWLSLVTIHKNIAGTLTRLQQFDEAERAFDRCINIIERIPDTIQRLRLLAKTYNDKGGLYLDHGADDPVELRRARSHFDESMAALNQLKAMGRTADVVEIITRINIASVQWKEGHCKEAENGFRENIERCRILGLHALECLGMRRLSDLLIEMGRLDDAESILKENEAPAEQPLDEQAMTELQLSRLFEAKGDYETALLHYKKYHEQEANIRDNRAKEAATLGNNRFEVMSLQRQVRQIISSVTQDAQHHSGRTLGRVLDMIDPTFTRKVKERIPSLSDTEYQVVVFMRYLGRREAGTIATLVYGNRSKANAVTQFQGRSRDKGGFASVDALQDWINRL